MIVTGSAVMLALAAIALPALPAGAEHDESPEQYAQLTIRESFMLLRVQRARAAPQPQTVWKERKGPKCVPSPDIAGAIVTGPDAVDLMLKGGKRVRARFRSSCPALDFYSGFYVRPPADRKICADRDAFHARSGGECEIDRFRELTPVVVDADPRARSASRKRQREDER